MQSKAQLNEVIGGIDMLRDVKAKRRKVALKCVRAGHETRIRIRNEMHESCYDEECAIEQCASAQSDSHRCLSASLAAVHKLALPEEQQPIEHLIGSKTRLVNRGNDDHSRVGE